MSTEYIKTSWQDGDIITADKMNNIENGIKDVDDTIGELKENLSDIREVYETRSGLNQFNPAYLTGAGWTYDNSTGEYVGTVYQIRQIYNYVLPITFKPNTQYLLTFDLYTEGNQGTTDTDGFIIRFMQSDDTQIEKKVKNTQTTSTHLTISTYNDMSSRSLESIIISYASLGENIWHLSNVMLTEGHVDTEAVLPEYEPYGSEEVEYTAVDIVARTGKLDANLGASEAGKQLVVNADGQIVTEEKEEIPTTISSTPSPDVLLYRDKIPEYFLSYPSNPASFDDDSYLDTKISKIPDGKHLIFFTDTHWESNARHSIPIIRYVMAMAQINHVLYGGDFIDRRTKYLGKQTLTDFTSQCKAAFGDKWLVVFGNHDTNLANYTGEYSGRNDYYLPFTILSQAYYSLIKGKVHTQAEYDYDKIAALTNDADELKELLAYFSCTYIYDDDDDHIRYIVLNTGAYQYGVVYEKIGLQHNQEMRIQYGFMDYALSTAPEGYDVILSGHDFAPPNSERTDVSVHSEAGRMFDMLGRRKTKRSYSFALDSNAIVQSWYDGSNFSYDYTNSPDIGRVMAIFGHNHMDYIFNTYYNSDGYIRYSKPYDGSALDQDHTGKVPIICTTTDAYNQDQYQGRAYDVDMELGTITEQAFDVVTLTDTQIKLTRFGAGSDRVVTF